MTKNRHKRIVHKPPPVTVCVARPPEALRDALLESARDFG